MSGDLRISMLIEADAARAKAEVASMSGAVGDLAGAGRQAGAVMVPAAGAVERMGRSSQTASVYAGQLGYQINDIGMMMALGQSPFMLMVQQGPQVVQVFNDMRRAGLDLGPAIAGAFSAMLSPMALVTMATIGLGAAAAQWFGTAEEATQTFDDAMDDLQTRIEAYRSAAERAGGSTRDLVKDFGAAAQAAQGYYRDIAEIERREAERAVRAANEKLQTDLGVYIDTPEYNSQADLADLFGLSVWERESRQSINAVIAAMGDLGRAEGFERQMEALDRLKAAMERAAMADGQFSEAEDAALRDINRLLLEQAGLREDLRRQKEAETANNGRFATADQRLDYLAEQAAAQAEASAWAQETLRSLAQENEIRALSLEYGRDSVVVAAARANAEREAFAELVASRDISEEMKIELLDAYDAANSITSVNISARIVEAIGPAAALAAQLWGAAKAAAAAAGVGRTGAVEGQGPAFEGGGRGGDTMAPYIAPAPTLDDLIARDTVRTGAGRGARSGGGGRGGGGPSEAERAVERQRDALKELREEQERQLELLRTTDPVQRVILENHRALAGAEEDERKVIVARILEIERLEDIRDKVDEIGAAGRNAFSGLISGASSFTDALSSVLDKLADMIASEAWDYLWSGGNTGWGGLESVVGGWLGFAEGGRVTGPGGPRDDAIPAWLSNGEFVMNAAATARNMPLLEALNNGASLGDMLSSLHGRRPIALADGGYLGDLTGAQAPSSWASAGRGGSGASTAPAQVEVGVRLFWDRNKGDWSAEMTRIAQAEASEAVGQGLEAFSTHALPGRVQEINDNPRVIG